MYQGRCAHGLIRLKDWNFVFGGLGVNTAEKYALRADEWFMIGNKLPNAIHHVN